MISAPLYAQNLPVRSISDDSSLRVSIKDTWLSEVPSAVLARAPVTLNVPGGGRVQLRTETNQQEFSIVLARELTGALRNVAGPFPGWAQGSWALTRDRATGDAIRIQVFLRSDPYAYIQFRPEGSDTCNMDIVLYGAFVRRSIPLPVSFDRLYTLPLTEVLSMAGDRFPLKYFEPDPAYYRDSGAFIARLREQVRSLEFADDGAIDENGNYVYINSGLPQKGEQGLNCSGYAKYVIDGILLPITGKRLAIDPLKAPFGQRGSSFTAPWEESRDPFFGLDWIRNLAAAALTALRSPAFATLDEIEVRADPFTQLIVRGRPPVIVSYPGFLDNAGYGVEGLQPLLYTLAIDEPGRFYLAAVNNEIGPPATADNPRGRPRLRQYYHVAVLIPWFNEYGVFQIAVFESAAETSFNAFRARYPGQYVNLVRIPVHVN
ncbi:MAG: hypothetical protein FWF29_04320 [Treponema sp.]|nr:hypothetical protein [Treponema sp.]